MAPESSLVTIPEEIYREACVSTTEEAIASCQVVGYPAMIKASWGGGGKGIRKVCFMCGLAVLQFVFCLCRDVIVSLPCHKSGLIAGHFNSLSNDLNF